MKISLKIAFVLLFFVSSAFAVTAPTKQAPANFQLDPQSLREQLLGANLSLVKSMYQVYDAKDRVNIARGNLLPSISVSGLIPHNGTFLISSINMLLPFLFPANWLEVAAQNDFLEAQKIAYQIMQLNTYSSALSLYYTASGDLKLKDYYQTQYDNLNKIYEIQKAKHDLGIISDEDLYLSESQANMAGVRVAQIVELNKQEIANLRAVLQLPISTTISIVPSDISLTPWEGHNINELVDVAYSMSPEHQQIEYLIKAAKHQAWEKVFAFMGSASLSSSMANGNNASFSNLGSSGTINFGFAMVPAYQLSARNVKEVELQDKDLLTQTSQVIEGTIGRLIEAQKEADLSANAQKRAQQVYDIILMKYNTGIGTFSEVILADSRNMDAKVNYLKSVQNLNLLRVVLNRTMLSDQFSFIKGCNLKKKNKSKKSFWERIFGSEEKFNIEEACQKANLAK